jgi:hypothetical protein
MRRPRARYAPSTTKPGERAACAWRMSWSRSHHLDRRVARRYGAPRRPCAVPSAARDRYEEWCRKLPGPALPHTSSEERSNRRRGSRSSAGDCVTRLRPRTRLTRPTPWPDPGLTHLSEIPSSSLSRPASGPRSAYRLRRSVMRMISPRSARARYSGSRCSSSLTPASMKTSDRAKCPLLRPRRSARDRACLAARASFRARGWRGRSRPCSRDASFRPRTRRSPRS